MESEVVEGVGPDGHNDRDAAADDSADGMPELSPWKPQQAKAPVVACPQGHLLERAHADAAFECDACGAPIAVCMAMMYCKECDFSACWLCHTQNKELSRIAEM